MNQFRVKYKWITIIVAILTFLSIIYYFYREEHMIETVKIGALFALTGDGADWGQDEADAAKMAIEDANKAGGINGKKIELILEDAPAEDTDKSVTAFNKLINIHKVAIVLGPTWDDVAAAIAPLADRNKVVVVAPDASSGIERKESYDYFFCVFAPEKSEMTRLVEFMKTKGVKKVGIVYNLDPFSKQWRDTFVDTAKNAGLDVKIDFPISDPESKDFRTQIARMKEADVDAVYIEFTSQDTKGPFMRQAMELGLDSMFLSSSTTDTQSLLDNYSQYMQNIFIASPKQTEAAKEFLKKFEKKFGHAPKSPAAIYAYDAANIAIEVIREGGDINENLYNLKDYKGVTSPGISFGKNGYVIWSSDAYEIKTVKGNKFESVE